MGSRMLAVGLDVHHERSLRNRSSASWLLGRELRYGPHRLAFFLGMPRSTIYRVLHRHGASRLRDNDRPTGLPVRYVREHPGELIVDGTERAGPRLLPAWDNVLMGYASRARFVDRSLTHEVVHRNGDILPVVPLDGRVAATWRVLRRPDRWQFRIKPLVGLSRTAIGRVEDETARVADNLAVVSEVLWLNS